MPLGTLAHPHIPSSVMALKSLTHFITFFTLFATIRSVPLAHRAEPGTCLSGSCSFKLVQPATTNGEPSEGSLVLDGSPNLISDITYVDWHDRSRMEPETPFRESAGWSSWDCEEGPEGHTIRLVCTGSDDTCNHVFQGGAEDTIVRVPSECKIGPYARIAASWDPKKLAIPNKINTVLGLKKEYVHCILRTPADSHSPSLIAHPESTRFVLTQTSERYRPSEILKSVLNHALIAITAKAMCHLPRRRRISGFKMEL